MKFRAKAVIAGCLGLLVIGGVYLSGVVTRTASIPIVFQLPWRHAGAFAGYYAADQLGAYRESGIEISFREGGGPVDPIESVLADEAQIGIASGNHILQARAEGKPVRAIAAIHQINPIVFAMMERSNIRHPRDFAGKVIRSSRTNLPVLQALAKRFGVGPDEYTIVDLDDTDEVYRRLYTGEIDVMTGFHFWTPNKLDKDGQAAVYIYPDDFGIHFYRDSIFTTDDFIEAHPEAVESFLRASLVVGWPFAFRQPDEAGSMTLKYRPQADASFETEFLTAMIPLINTGDVPLGWMRPDRWAQMGDALKDIGFVEPAFDPREAYTTRFLENIYPDANP